MKHSVYAAVVLLFALSASCPVEDSPARPPGRRVSDKTRDTHALFTEILQRYVEQGRVNYRALCKDQRLERYIARLAATNPDNLPSDEARLAFWINAYNAFTLKIICDNYPVESINDLHFGGRAIGHVLKRTIWDKKFIEIVGEKISLNDIEHKIIRGTGTDVPFAPACPSARCPRAHFALVCASVSCPPLRPEAYEAHKLEGQLDDQGRVFFTEGHRNHFDIENKTAHLSKILDWYAEDFGSDNEERLLYISRFLRNDIAAALRADPKSWKIKYTKYDWCLNE